MAGSTRKTPAGESCRTVFSSAQKSASRNKLVQEARRAMRRLTKQMQTSICDFPEVKNLMQKLAHYWFTQSAAQDQRKENRYGPQGG